MADDTRARQAAAGPDVVARLRRWAEFCDHGVAPLLPEAAAAIEARDAEIARLREALGAIVDTLDKAFPGMRGLALIIKARAALAPPPASDGGEA